MTSRYFGDTPVFIFRDKILRHPTLQLNFYQRKEKSYWIACQQVSIAFSTNSVQTLNFLNFLKFLQFQQSNYTSQRQGSGFKMLGNVFFFSNKLLHSLNYCFYLKRNLTAVKILLTSLQQCKGVLTGCVSTHCVG